MKAVIIPGITDLNKGDQALVWESYRLIEDTELYESIYVLTSGDSDEEKELLCGQTRKRDFKFIEHILKHPRRGKHKKNEAARDSFITLFRLTWNAIHDFIFSFLLLLICNNYFLLNLFFSKKIKFTISLLKECDTFFVKGGGFIHAYGERIAPYLMWYALFYIRLAEKLHKTVVILPNSFGPFKGMTVKKQVKRVLSKVGLIFAREGLSVFMLSELLGKTIPIQMDVGFFLKMANKEKVFNLLQKYNIGINDKVIGITVRPWRFPGLKDGIQLYNNYLYSMEKLVEYLLNQHYKVVFCNQSLGPNAHEDDRNIIRILYNKLQEKNLIWINENLSCDELKAIYSHFYLLIGTRFHSVIFSMTTDVPSISISYGGNKGQGIMSDYDLGGYVISIDEITSDKIIDIFNNMAINYSEIKNKLKEINKKIEISRLSLLNEIKLYIAKSKKQE
jgi:colanic acid/amylovoran biosynthesis protein